MPRYLDAAEEAIRSFVEDFWERNLEPESYAARNPPEKVERQLARDEVLLKAAGPLAAAAGTAYVYTHPALLPAGLPNYSNISHLGFGFVLGAVARLAYSEMPVAAIQQLSEASGMLVLKEGLDLLKKGAGKIPDSVFDLAGDLLGIGAGWKYEDAVMTHFSTLRRRYVEIYAAATNS